MQNNNNNRKILNSKKDSLPAAEVQSNVNNYRNKKSATSIKRSNNNNNKSNNIKNNTTNNHINNTNAIIGNTNNSFNNAKTNTSSNLHTKLYKSNGYTKQISATTITTTEPTKISSLSTPTPISTSKTTTTTTDTIIAEVTSRTASSLAISQNCGIQETNTENDLVVKTKKTSGTSGIGQGQGVNMKSKAILSETFSSKTIDTISSTPPQHNKQPHQYSLSASSSCHKARNHSFSGNTKGGLILSNGGGNGNANKTKKLLVSSTTSETTTNTPTTSLAISQKQSTALTVLPTAIVTAPTMATTTAPTTLIKIKTTSTSGSGSASNSKCLSVASNGNISNSNGNGSGGFGGITITNTNNSNKNFQIPSDILDDLASRFVINVPDMELSNLIRICFQIELAHWFYLDFFCTACDEEKELLKPVGMKYFATQLFQHIPFLSQHLPMIDSVLEDWKNYKLAVPTYGAILISEDLQYCLLVQSYFAKSSWGFPKGKVNETEDPEHCATREVFEETGYDITGLIVPKDYIEAVINDQYTRLYIVCNVSLDTVFEPRTRNEIRCCVWFPIDSLPNNKNDAISKAKLGQNANSFFMILPFVKRLKKWVNEKRLKACKIDNNNGGTGAAAVGGGLGTCLPHINNGNINPNSTNKLNDRRKYSTNGCQNNATTNNGAILKSPSLGYVGEIQFNLPNRSNGININTNTNIGKKNRQQQQQHQQQQKITSNNNSNNNKSNNIAGCFELSEIETTTFGAVVANTDAAAAAASAAANARSKRQRHKSMGDLDNMNAFNNSNNKNNNNNIKNLNSCKKSIYINSNQINNKRNSVQKMNISSGNDIHHNNDNAANNNGGSSRRQLFHSHSENDGVNGEIDGDTEQSISSFSFIRQERQQQNQQWGSENSKYTQQNQKTDMVQYFTEIVVSNSDEQIRKHKRQRAKSQSDKACNNNQQQQQVQLQTINDCYFSNNNKNNTSSSRPNLQRQSSLISTSRTTILKTSTTTNISNIVNTADKNEIGDNITNANNNDSDKNINQIDNTGAGDEIIQYGDKILLGQQHPRHRRYATATAPTMTGNDLIAWSAACAQYQQQQNTVTPTGRGSGTGTGAINSKNDVNNESQNIKAVFEASAIETRLIEEQLIKRQLEEVKKQQQNQQQPRNQRNEIFPYMLNVQQSHKLEQQKEQFSFLQNQQQPHHPLQHSASSPGLATWKNFSFTKNLISNVFL